MGILANPSSCRGNIGGHRLSLRLEPLEPRILLSAGAEPQALEVFSALPARFVENQGQWPDASVRFAHDGNGVNVALTDMGPRFQVFRQEPEPDAEGTPGDPLDPEHAVTDVLEFSASLVGAEAVVPVGLEPSESVFNYYVGDQANWLSAVPSYEVVVYPDLYPGVDLHVWGLRSHLKYEFHVAPGADWSQIQVRYEGIAGLSLAEDGSLAVDLGDEWGSVVDDAPYIYQQIGGEEVEVAGCFLLLDDVTYGFEITGELDPSRTLIVDPELAWSTYLGGGSSDNGHGIAADADGNVLVTGDTVSSGWLSGGFDTSYNGVRDAFVAKLSPTGTHLWSTYLGGSSGDWGYGIAVDTGGNVLLTGTTMSSGWVSGGFDTTPSGLPDAFVAKLSPSGSHVWSTYLSGSTYDEGRGIAVDAAGNALVTGYTSSSGFAWDGFDTTYNGAGDAFVAKLSSSGDHLWSTYLGGSVSDGGYGIAVDATGNALVTGRTGSSGWASGGFDTTYNGGGDAFVAKLSPSGDHVWSTYLGGSGVDYALSGPSPTTAFPGITVDAAGNALVTGSTASSGWVSGGFDTSHSAGRDAFVAKLSPTGDHLWSTYLGNGSDGCGIAADADGNALVTGGTGSSGWVSGGFDTTRNGNYDAFVAKLSPSGDHLWSSYLGGGIFDYGRGIAVDSAGNPVVTGETTSSSGWVSGGFDTTYGGSIDAFVARILTGASSPTGLSITDWSGAEGDSGTRNAAFVVTLASPASGTVTVDWATADASASAWSDYVPANGTLTFPVGSTQQWINVEVCGDTSGEGDEAFHVLLSNPTGGAEISDGDGLGTIEDDDGSSSGLSVLVGDGGLAGSCTYVDPQGVTVKIRVRRGTASLRFDTPLDWVAGSRITITTPGVRLVKVEFQDETSERTQLSIKVGRGSFTRIGEIRATHEIGKISAPRVILDGTGLYISEGYAKSVRLGGMEGTARIHMLGDNRPSGVTLNLGLLDGSWITCASPIKSLKAGQWAGGGLEAPWIRTMAITGAPGGIRGDCELWMHLNSTNSKGISLGKLSIAGVLHDAEIYALGSVGKVTVGAATNATILAGVDDSFGYWTPTLDDLGYGWKINAFKAKSLVRDPGVGRHVILTENLILGAWHLGKVHLGLPETSDPEESLITILTNMIKGKNGSFIEPSTGRRYRFGDVVTPPDSTPPWLDIDPASVVTSVPSGTARGKYGVRLQAVSSAGDAATATIKINGNTVAQGTRGVTYDRASDPDWEFYRSGTILEISVSAGFLTFGSQIFIIDPRSGHSELLFDNAMGQDLGWRIVRQIP